MPVAARSPDPFSDPRPPKPPPKNRMPVSVGRDLTAAVKDTVHVRNHSSSDSPSRRVARSQTTSSPVPPPKHTSHRSYSQDASPRMSDKAKPSKSRSSKKGSQHADIIDRLDYTGVGANVFHHDSPFDACAPSRNKHKTRAPMAAWTPGSDRGAGGPYPTADAYGAFDQGAQYDAPKKKVDAIAEAWGIHEPEPFEEFNAGGGRGDTPTSSIYNDREGRSRRNDEQPRSRAAGKRSLPPPQPIFISDSVGEDDVIVSTPGGGGMPKRSKSLMQRIKKMRDAPNVPVDSDYQPASEGDESRPSRPTHRTQNSFLGRFNKPESPTEPFILVDAQTNKNLPSVPYGGTPGSPSSPREDYFDRAHPSRNDNQSPGAVGSPGLGRKTSLMKRMKGVVRNL